MGPSTWTRGGAARTASRRTGPTPSTAASPRSCRPGCRMNSAFRSRAKIGHAPTPVRPTRRPVLPYLQQAGVGGRTVEDAGTQDLVQRELAVYLQDTWKPDPRLTLNYGLRWEAQIEPDPITPPESVFFAPFIGTVSKGQAFPSDGKIPSDKNMFQPRLGLAYDVDASGRPVVRGSAGI